ncbi:MULTISPECIES: SusC/RagA family TonB-linked outer membrane protein [Sphingobacterium]|uniref:SusC/RagA family TonB-linked outer membrane protein n=1 Tax=Sphingobacterium TaxID=28453 RepID=UPI0013DD5400|nr:MULTISPECIES: SusC/RagA family TonB-linked outer membrane protein [unclassified Sphingobacterium]
MKLTAILICLALMQVSASTFGQKVTLRKSNITLEKLFWELRKQTGYDILLTTSKAKNSQTLTVDFKDTPIDQVMAQIAEDSSLSYTIGEKNVVVKEKVEAVAKDIFNKEHIAVAAIDVRGKITDSHGHPIRGASIKLKGSKRSTVTREGGLFLFRQLKEGSILLISCIGFEEREVKAKSDMGTIILHASQSSLEEVDIFFKKKLGTQVDLKHKFHLNLGQVLEGGVPGLTLKPAITTKEGEVEYLSPLWEGSTAKNLREEYERIINGPGAQEFLSRYPTYEDWEKSTNWLSMSNATKGASKTVDGGLVPELQGASNFGAATSGMLIVIDGFPQENFPSDYPMNNVESVEVVSDPEECLKWGPKAAGGIVFITTKRGQSGKIQVNYTSNLYFSTPPDNSAEKLQLASSADILSYYKEVYDRGFAKYDPRTMPEKPGTLRPAESLLFDLGKKKLSQEEFQSKWDSLGRISNRSQLRSLQQNIFNQNHSLQLSGGSSAYQFSVNGLYRKNMTTDLGSNNQEFGLGIRNNLRVLEGKLNARWLINLSRSSNYRGDLKTADLDPYQLLFDDGGEYVYFQRDAQLNDQMMNVGYYNNGLNLYEDLISSYTERKANRIDGNFDADYQVLKGLKWSTAIKFSKSKSVDERLTGAQSSTARQLFNEYGVPSVDGSEVTFYVPIGDLYKKTQSSALEYRITTGLKFNHSFDNYHDIAGSLDMGIGSAESKNNPFATIYGYSRALGVGLPLLATQSTDLKNYNANTLDFNKLFVPGINVERYDRNINLNGNFLYSFKKKYDLNVQYLSSYMPKYGYVPAYAATVSKLAGVSWHVGRENFFRDRLSFIDEMKLTVSANEVGIPKLSASQVSGNRFEQPVWGNSMIFISSFNFAQQSGQKNRSISGGIDTRLFENKFVMSLKYNRNTLGSSGWNGRVSYDIASSSYFNSSWINMLRVGMVFQSLNPFQGMGIMLGANSVTNGGGGSVPIGDAQGLLPPSKINKEATMDLGFMANRYTLSVRYYNNTTEGLAQGLLPTDPSTGLQSRLNYSKISNQGFNIGFSAALFRNIDFEWRVMINGAYNVNKALEVPKEAFSLRPSYLTAARSGYTTDNLWSFNWAGLDTLGNPQYFREDGSVVSRPDEMTLVYSGKTRAPISGGVFNNWQYKSVFVGARLMFNFGHIMRRYTPSMTPDIDKSIWIADRWRKPGDENLTDIPAIAKHDATRSFGLQNASHTIMSADNIRLREIQLGWEVPPSFLQSTFLKRLTVSGQVENVALWTRNSMDIDPDAVSNNGTVGLSRPTNFVLSVNIGF